jgi:ABC-2 type transport system ATP-binding protein
VEVRDLVKSYGQIEAVRGIGFEVKPGETFGFLGPTEAGKSTTIKILCTLVTPSAGRPGWPGMRWSRNATR